MIPTQSPRAWRKPAWMAGVWPKFRVSFTTVIVAGCRRADSLRIANDLSREPSSTKTSSRSYPSGSSSRTARSRGTVSGRLASF